MQACKFAGLAADLDLSAASGPDRRRAQSKRGLNASKTSSELSTISTKAKLSTVPRPDRALRSGL
jgi:hypothetical protein